jgi:hypothetical protein
MWLLAGKTYDSSFDRVFEMYSQTAKQYPARVPHTKQVMHPIPVVVYPQRPLASQVPTAAVPHPERKLRLIYYPTPLHLPPGGCGSGDLFQRIYRKFLFWANFRKSDLEKSMVYGNRKVRKRRFAAGRIDYIKAHHRRAPSLMSLDHSEEILPQLQ